jgi:hypothetical protein
VQGHLPELRHHTEELRRSVMPVRGATSEIQYRVFHEITLLESHHGRQHAPDGIHFFLVDRRVPGSCFGSFRPEYAVG